MRKSPQAPTKCICSLAFSLFSFQKSIKSMHYAVRSIPKGRCLPAFNPYFPILFHFVITRFVNLTEEHVTFLRGPFGTNVSSPSVPIDNRIFVMAPFISKSPVRDMESSSSSDEEQVFRYN